ncbi:MAG: M20/M25/M40 family metallo-hydrolase [Anaerolineales bacterium]|jgi:glutamate carboxypeptidase
MTEPQQNITSYLESKLDHYLNMLHEMVAINSFTANSDGVNKLGMLTGRNFAELSFDPTFVQCENKEFGKHLVLRSIPFEEAKPTISLISHLDTVFSPEDESLNDFSWRIEGDRIYGPGTVDIKGGTVMIYMVLEGLRKYQPQIYKSVNWMVFFNAAEESLSPDFGNLCVENLPEKTIACLVFEGGKENEGKLPLVVARKGRATFLVKAEGRSAHAGNNHDRGANAVVQIAHTIQSIADFTDYEKEITFNPGTIQGGTVVNRVPHFARAEVEMRAFEEGIFKAGVNKMKGLSGSTQVTSQDGYPCKVTVDLIDQVAPWSRNENTIQLYKLWMEVAQSLGIEIVEEARGGLSDGNWLWNYFPTLDGLGPTGANTHCSQRSADGSKDQEYVLISSFLPKAVLNITAITKLVKSA